MEIGASEAEAIWTALLRKLTRRGLSAVKLVISDAHEGIKTAVTEVLRATWQRCRVHFMRNVLAHAGKNGRPVASAFIATAIAQETLKPPAPNDGPLPTRYVLACPSSPPPWTRPNTMCSLI